MPTPSSRHPRSVARLAAVSALLTGAVTLAFVPACTQDGGSPPTSEAANMKTVLLPIEGMTCSSCVARVKKELLAMEGVAEVSVDLVERQARIRFDGEQLSNDHLVNAIDGLGYRAGVPKEIR